MEFGRVGHVLTSIYAIARFEFRAFRSEAVCEFAVFNITTVNIRN
jgi:hypothetical protein